MDEIEENRAKEFCGLLKQMDWNQSETGRELGVTSNYINMIVNGNCPPSEALLKHLALRVGQSKKAGGEGFVTISKLLNRVPEAYRENAVEAVKGVLTSYAKPAKLIPEVSRVRAARQSSGKEKK